MLEKLSKKDKKWRQIAFNICKSKHLADDIVQDMYLKAMKYKKPINDAYVYFIIKSLFLDYCRKQSKNKTISLESLHYLQDKNSLFEINDKELYILNEYKKIDWKQQELIIESYDKSLRQIEKEFPYINYAYAYRQIKEGREAILKNIL